MRRNTIPRPVSDIYYLRWLDQYLNGVELQTIERDVLDKISAVQQAEEIDNSTVNCVKSLKADIL